MFSINRYNGENEEDTRTLEKKQERLNKLNNKLASKKRKDSSQVEENDHKKIKADPLKKNRKKEPEVEEKATDENEQEQEHQPSEQEEEEESQEQSSPVEEAMDMDPVEQDNVPTLEAFPEMVGPKTKRSKEEKKLLRSMGIPEWMLQPTVVSPKDSCGLDQVGLSSHLVQRCQDLGLSSLFAVQMAVIPVFLRRQALYDTRRVPGDLCISAPTGSGKTMAYVLPIVDILSKRVVTRLRAVIVLPTRDLVTQVKETFDAFVKGTNLVVAAASGQQSFAHEQHVLVGSNEQSLDGGKSRVDILITTPGRLMDHLTLTPNFTLQHLRFLVIDEADRLLNQSYNDWLNQILLATRPEAHLNAPSLDFKHDKYGVTESDAIAPSFLKTCYSLPSTELDLPKVPSIQKLLFSATLTKNPAKIAGLHLNDPEYISVQNEDGSDMKQEYTTPEGLKEYMTICPTEKKPLMVIYLLHQLGIKSGLCFTKSVESTQRLYMLIEAYEATQPEEKRIRVKEYSSELRPVQRKQLLKQFKGGQIDLLICSDLIGRGIDLDSVQFVISYDVPYYMDKYIHRVGRTARAGREGEAYTLVEKQEARHFKEILRHAGHLSQIKTLDIEKAKLKELVPDYEKAMANLTE
ncbi:P-loop containing nucleoside triphosphate hydrolase protein [Gilbertella persicaria]|uniref:P-loop containing nucleoside triphosphate hydrolase protein n=1 Tax=Gilbertella persicaria TaxID=101096 RepID=UPI00221F78CD|nr:P-loop containing nucleoside triphosphate hydrolase protein [Gilbertella persicaria]KAI8087744.1 P-loop containing nucleoside triphosphate hydrolase protein [Gilbertella persicaria]